ncbi:hypothetical protein EXIGLDRAFT_731455 [Exidia glandulosa HHB12029]|uniref:F-box domain-containing protein n=1 Tax=Exidia glandulosa HHB12029 TaxID=1314781 RepID=A0A165L102_EXIGL|nr:hypothetical protein EXIGLDRAFT_731455 [Exidia glandulosa HHB12029]
MVVWSRSRACAASRLVDLISTIRHAVIAVVDSSAATFCSALNDHVPVWRLPSELLCSVFEHLDLHGRISSSHVCRTWRAVSLAAPAQLWSSIASSRPNVLEVRLARAGTAPLHLRLGADDETIADISALLKLYWHRIHTLYINCSDCGNDAFEETISSLVCQPAPQLKAFTYRHSLDQLPDVAWRNLFSGQHRSLQLLKLDISPSVLRQQREPLLSVRRLLIRLAQCLPSDIGNIFHLFPQVEALALDVFGSPNDDPQSVTYEPPATLRCIRIGCLFLPRGDPTVLLHRLNVDTIQDVVVVYGEELPLWRTTSISEIRFATVHYTYPGNSVNLYLHLSNGSRRAFLGFDWEVQASIFQSLVVLKISEVAWHLDEPIPSTPHLESLTVYSALPRHWHRERAPTVLSDTTGNPVYQTLSCPALKHVTFAARVPSLSDLANMSESHTHLNERTFLAAEAVVSFLSRRLDYASPLLESVLFQGVGVLSINPDGVGRLLLMAKDVRLEQRLAANDSSLDFMFDLLSIENSVDDDDNYDSVYTRIL